MFELYFLIGAIIGLNIYTHNEVSKDGAYFLDEEKPFSIKLIWALPIIGAGLALYRLHADKEFYMTVMVIYFVLRFGLYYVMFELF